MSFCSAINCMDGRVQIPTIEYLRKQYGVDDVDMITEAGPVALLAEGSSDALLTSIYNRIGISLNAHDSQLIAIAAHAQCAGNPISDDAQKVQLNAAVERLKANYNGVEIIALWIDSDWTVHSIKA